MRIEAVRWAVCLEKLRFKPKLQKCTTTYSSSFCTLAQTEFQSELLPLKASCHGIVKIIPPNRIRRATQETHHVADSAEALSPNDT